MTEPIKPTEQAFCKAICPHCSKQCCQHEGHLCWHTVAPPEGKLHGHQFKPQYQLMRPDQELKLAQLLGRHRARLNPKELANLLAIRRGYKVSENQSRWLDALDIIETL